ncbi:MAG TPA: amino acid--tRNA ligase-related protein [Dehalococcoidales bacterium]|nr:amino acid--tRNA ligase-related protein [Dehalococcoidales bacterium]
MNLDESRRLASIKSKLEYRARTLAGIRAFFTEEDFLEIDTPIRVPAVAPEQFIAAYTSEGWFLSTSPELQMKRLLAAGYRRIFQIARCFRKDERGRHHNPEFTMLEWYRAGADYNQIIADTENLVLFLAGKNGLGRQLSYQGHKIDLSPPWPRITVREAYIHQAGWDPFIHFDGQRFDDDMVDKIIPSFPVSRPVVIMDYPPQCAALARLKAGHPAAAERAEIFLAGLEIANIYSELTDPAEQVRRFKEEMKIILEAGRPSTWPQKFIEAVPQMPPCGGIALGIDRLVMLFSDTASIDEVMAFPSDLL